MPECLDCGGHVTEQFARVFGDRDDVIHGCPECSTFAELQRGGAAGRQLTQL